MHSPLVTVEVGVLGGVVRALVSLAGVGALLGTTSAAAQSEAASRWVVDPTTSLVWWQIDPHFNHLWATTCPNDESWQAGEGRSGGYRYVKDPKLPDAAHKAERIPLWPRGDVNAVCSDAVGGFVTAADRETWRGVRGEFTVNPDSLITGHNMRDRYARSQLFQTGAYRAMRFTVDSLINVQDGDTLAGTAIGTFELRGVQTRVAVPLKIWPEGGQIRVVGHTNFPAEALTNVYGMSKFKLGLGVGLAVWETVYWGVDLMLQPSRQ